MDTIGVNSFITGVLYLLVYIAGVLSIARAVDNPDYLKKAAQRSGQIKKAALFQFLMAVLYIGIAFLLYPLLKSHNETLALGFFGFRLLAALLVIIGAVLLLSILKLSQKFVNDNDSATANYKLVGEKLKAARDFVNHVLMILMLCLSNMILYSIMIQSGLIPFWLSAWGLLGTAIALLASIFVWFKYVQILSITYMILNLPLALQEIVFALWLIQVGFITSSHYS